MMNAVEARKLTDVSLVVPKVIEGMLERSIKEAAKSGKYGVYIPITTAISSMTEPMSKAIIEFLKGLGYRATAIREAGPNADVYNFSVSWAP